MRLFCTVLLLLVLQACKHPLAIVGEGDIVELNGSGRGCTLEQYQLQDVACTDNEVTGDYIVNYSAIPKPGWIFVRWEGFCGHLSSFPDCRIETPAATVSWWDANFSQHEPPTLTAVFEEPDSDSDGVVDRLDDFPLDPAAWDRDTLITAIYVSDVGFNRNGPHVIYRYDEQGNNGTKFITSQLARPQDIVFLEDQDIVLVSNLQTNNINKYDIQTGEYIGEFANGLNGPTRLEIGPDGLVYAIQWGGGFVKRYQQNGDFVDDFTDVAINQAIGIAWDSENNLYVSSFNNGNNGFVRKFNASGANQGLFINTNLSGPTDIWFDEEGNMLVSDWSANKVKKFNSLGSFVADFVSNISQPEGVDFLDGDVLIGDSRNGSVKMYDSDGMFLQNIISPGAAGLTTTNAVTVRSYNQ
jgi:hypothetical protein